LSNLLLSGHYNRVYILAASADGDRTAAFRVGAKTANLNIEDWGGFIGQWDTRIFRNPDDRNWAISAHHALWPPADEQQREQRVPSPRYPEDYVGLEPGYVKPAGLAWYASHHHTADGLNQPYQYCYLFAYSIQMPRSNKLFFISLVEVQMESRSEKEERAQPHDNRNGHCGNAHPIEHHPPAHLGCDLIVRLTSAVINHKVDDGRPEI
jgi:hypothetical protein